MKEAVFKFIFICFSLLIPWCTSAGSYLLPKPQSVIWSRSSFVPKSVAVSGDFCVDEVIGLFSEWDVRIDRDAKKKVEIRSVSKIDGTKVNTDEAYRLVVDQERILIEAVTDRGAYWAIQTLRQLAVCKENRVSIKGCIIVDWPAFRIRGFMHDVGRGYIPVEELKQEITQLARYKINTFHWHLTENQAWRIESRLFPMLNDSSNFTRFPGKYYTLDEIRDLVAYCRKHRVWLLPEIDMPGHSAAFTRAFRHDMQSKEGMTILKLLMDEICEAFSGVPYMHIGTDEVAFTNPEFVPGMVEYIRKKGFQVFSWNPGWKYKKGEIDWIHMWSSRGKIHDGIPSIDSRLHYVNHYDAFADLVALFKSNIAEVPYGTFERPGVIMAFWNDKKVNSVQDILISNGFYPIMLTCAERAWFGGGEKYFYQSGTLLQREDKESFDAFSDFEDRMLWHKDKAFEGFPFAYVRQSQIHWRITDAFPNEGDLKKQFPPEEKLDTVYRYNGEIYRTRPAIGAAIYLRHVWGSLIPSFYENPLPNHTAYAYTWVYSPKRQTVGLWACTQNYGRSECDYPPPAGKWDYRESRIWVNNREVQPPVWTENRMERNLEIPMGNENFETRPPIPVTLEKGWNKVLLKLPVGNFTTPEVRLVKWMFTAVFVTLDGKNAAELIYSPEKRK